MYFISLFPIHRKKSQRNQIINLVTPLYIEAPLENPLLFLQTKQTLDQHHEKIDVLCQLNEPVNQNLSVLCSTFSGGQHILVCSCSSFLQALPGNFPAAKEKRMGFQISSGHKIHLRIKYQIYLYTGKLICVEGPQYLRAARS